MNSYTKYGVVITGSFIRMIVLTFRVNGLRLELYENVILSENKRKKIRVIIFTVSFFVNIVMDIYTILLGIESRLSVAYCGLLLIVICL